jgi:hypothetical protein
VSDLVRKIADMSKVYLYGEYYEVFERDTPVVLRPGDMISTPADALLLPSNDHKQARVVIVGSGGEAYLLDATAVRADAAPPLREAAKPFALQGQSRERAVLALVEPSGDTYTGCGASRVSPRPVASPAKAVLVPREDGKEALVVFVGIGGEPYILDRTTARDEEGDLAERLNAQLMVVEAGERK